jgi:hypothetical protein
MTFCFILYFQVDGEREAGAQRRALVEAVARLREALTHMYKGRVATALVPMPKMPLVDRTRWIRRQLSKTKLRREKEPVKKGNQL